jgi:hypothetical protein
MSNHRHRKEAAMSADNYRRGPRLAVLAAIALIPAACGTRAASPAPAASRPAPAATATTAATTAAARPVASASGPMTGAELVWLAGIRTLHQKMDRILTDAPSPITTHSMGAFGDEFAACTTELDRLGPPTDRLRPVYDLATPACGQYEKAGACFATAAKLGTVVAGSANERRQREATDCGFAAPGDGSQLFADAEVKGFDISEAAH